MLHCIQRHVNLPGSLWNSETYIFSVPCCDIFECLAFCMKQNTFPGLLWEHFGRGYFFSIFPMEFWRWGGVILYLRCSWSSTTKSCQLHRNIPCSGSHKLTRYHSFAEELPLESTLRTPVLLLLGDRVLSVTWLNMTDYNKSQHNWSTSVQWCCSSTRLSIQHLASRAQIPLRGLINYNKLWPFASWSFMKQIRVWSLQLWRLNCGNVTRQPMSLWGCSWNWGGQVGYLSLLLLGRFSMSKVVFLGA